MSDIAIRVENLSKRYRLGVKEEKQDTLVGSVLAMLKRPGQNLQRLRRLTRFSDNGADEKDAMWALKDVSFEVKQGEVVGVIGRNGAGKSTLLKILSRITYPTAGRVELHGRVSSLLEVGTGFHPELTGRENIYLNGTILGMRKAEIDRKFDEIVDFSGIEKFIDTPVKRYSSGMGVRLAFSVAAHLEPEILLVDEVLAVGDAQFQKKCLGKMSNVVQQGRTILFVSHNMTAIESLCPNTLWLERGKIIEYDKTNSIISKYMEQFVQTNSDRLWTDMKHAPGNERIRVRRAVVRPIDTMSQAPIDMLTSIVLEYDYWNLVAGTFLNVSLHVYNEMGVMAFNTTSIHETEWGSKPFEEGLYRSTVVIPGHLLNSGIYMVELLFVEDQSRILFRMDESVLFHVLDSAATHGAWLNKWPGVVHPSLTWETRLLTSSNQN